MADVKYLPGEFFSKYVKGKKFLDIGSGDGRIVTHAILCGANAFGVELYDEMIRKCVFKRRIKKCNFLDVDFNNYEVLFYYVGSNAKDFNYFRLIKKLESFKGIFILYYRKVEETKLNFENNILKNNFKKLEEIENVSVYKQ
jgi:cyclopropane fatty-acyl-phospholipid synthase-like methyltransferase